MAKQIYRVDIVFDDEAEIYVATCKDLKGFVTEHRSLDGLKERVLELLPDMVRAYEELAEEKGVAKSAVRKAPRRSRIELREVIELSVAAA